MSVRFHQFNMNFFLLDLNNNSLKYRTALSLQPILLAALVLFSTNTLPSRIKSLHFLSLVTITSVNFAVSAHTLTSKQPAPLPPPAPAPEYWNKGGHGQFFLWGGAHGERVECEPITGVWGQSPQRGPGAEPLVRESGGEAPPEAESFLALGRATDRANLYPLQYFQQSITIR